MQVRKLFRSLHNIISAPVIGLSGVAVAITFSYGATSPALRNLKHGFEIIPLEVDAKKFDPSHTPQSQ